MPKTLTETAKLTALTGLIAARAKRRQGIRPAKTTKTPVPIRQAGTDAQGAIADAMQNAWDQWPQTNDWEVVGADNWNFEGWPDAQCFASFQDCDDAGSSYDENAEN